MARWSSSHWSFNEESSRSWQDHSSASSSSGLSPAAAVFVPQGDPTSGWFAAGHESAWATSWAQQPQRQWQPQWHNQYWHPPFSTNFPADAMMQSYGHDAVQQSEFGNGWNSSSIRSEARQHGIPMQDKVAHINHRDEGFQDTSPRKSEEEEDEEEEEEEEKTIQQLPLQQGTHTAGQEDTFIVLEPCESWLSGSKGSGLEHEYLQISTEGEQNLPEEPAEVPESWEDVDSCEELAVCLLYDNPLSGPVLLPWYGKSFLLCCRPPPSPQGIYTSSSAATPSSSEDGGSLKVLPRPLPAVDKPRVKAQRICAQFLNGSDDGVTFALAPSKGIASAGLTWQESEQIEWNWLQPSEQPFITQNSCRMKWRFHCIGLRQGPAKFKVGCENSLHLKGAVGGFTRAALTPGIMDVNLDLKRGQDVEVHVRRGASTSVCQIDRIIFAAPLALCLEHRIPEQGLCCLCPQAVEDAESAIGQPGFNISMPWESMEDYIAG
jgi:hypothetical protein